LKHRLLPLAWVVLGLAGGAARDAAAQSVAAAPSPAQQCLTRAPGSDPELLYPSDLLVRKDRARFKVSLSFRGPDSAPRFKLLDDSRPIDKEFIDAVEKYVAGFRVPCMAPDGPPAVLQQEYVFAPNEGRKVMASAPVDEQARQRKELAKCVKHQSAEVPRYPEGARVLEEQGNVFVELAFDGPASPPTVKVHASSSSRLEAAALKLAQGMRMPCHPGDGRHATDILYKYQLVGGKRTLLKDTNVASLVRAAASFPRPAYFDWSAMGCPFELRLMYQQPHRPNIVYQLETDRPERWAFMEWLGALRLKLDDKTNTAVLGDTMTLSVPCGQLDL
jgi:hypothetical protein